MNTEDSTQTPLYADSPPWYSRLSLWAVTLIVPLLGLFRGGRYFASQEIVQTAIFVLLACLSLSLFRSKEEHFLRRLEAASTRVIIYCGLGFLALLSFQLLPLPFFLLNLISEQSSALYQHAPNSFGSISIDTGETIRHGAWFLALLVLLLWFLQLPRSVFRAASFHQPSSQSRNRVRVVLLDLDYVCHLLARAVVWAAVLFSALSLAHQAVGVDSLFGLYPAGETGRRAHVPFANPNHLAVFLEIALFLSISFFFFALDEPATKESEQQLSVFWALWKKVSVWKYGFVSLFLFVALVASVSRMGIVLALAGVAAFFLLLLKERRETLLPSSVAMKSKKGSWLTESGVIAIMKLCIVLVFVAAALIAFLGDSGGDVVADRFGAGVAEGLDVIRRELFSISLQAVPTYFLFGAGLGCWHFAVSPFTTERLAGISLDYAHNDLLQLLVETGFFGFSIAILAIGFVIRMFIAAWRRSAMYVERVNLLGSFLAVALPLLHSLIDFPFHIPVIAVAYILALAVLLRRIEGCQ